jgi:hypothetical protein
MLLALGWQQFSKQWVTLISLQLLDIAGSAMSNWQTQLM